MMRLIHAMLLMFISSYVFAIEKADRVLVNKSDRTLILIKNDKAISTFSVAFGSNPKGHKVQEGDEKTPEGHYILDYKKADSAFYKAIHISYPNKADIERANILGVSSGGSIMIHGQKNGYGWAAPLIQLFNWTEGCIALKNSDMDLIWQAVEADTPIEIRP